MHEDRRGVGMVHGAMKLLGSLILLSILTLSFLLPWGGSVEADSDEIKRLTEVLKDKEIVLIKLLFRVEALEKKAKITVPSELRLEVKQK